MEFSFRTQLWLHDDQSAWHFLTVPRGIADEIDDLVGDTRAGFGSVKVAVEIGSTSWRTSIFPSKLARSFVLPVKKSVRVDEDLFDGDIVLVSMEVLLGS